MIVHTAWDCGTLRSTHTAFNWQRPEPTRIVKPTGKKRGPKPRQTKLEATITAMDTPEEKSARIKAKNAAAKAAILRENKNQFTPVTQADKDRNAVIAGRSIFMGRTQ
jgi:hypothetical protein